MGCCSLIIVEGFHRVFHLISLAGWVDMYIKLVNKLGAIVGAF
jgi:hypothetical protein